MPYKALYIDKMLKGFMSNADDKPKKNKAAWRDKRADVMRENLKKRKMMQRARSEMEKSADNATDESKGENT